MSDLSMYNFDFEENTKWQKVLDLTHAVWKVVDLSVESNVLKNKIKDLASEILTKYTGYVSNENINEDAMIRLIDDLLALLSLAQKTSNLREINFLILKNEYKKIKFYMLSDAETNKLNGKRESEPPVSRETEEIKEEVKKERYESNPTESFKKDFDNEEVSFTKETFKAEPAETKENKLSDRQEIIMNFFKERRDEKVRLRDVKKFFPKYTDRTIRNDLKGLCDAKLILRSDGRGQGSFYYLNRK